ncbi:MAG: hypothetical protein KJ676_02430 [Alphaproteobacteria bacterium]|nr:hypothetical protein [Alphaproteobacteria bacterium]MBU1524843.1 hypothetical protein [Alphaproteobacteria bacterium]MBU2116036.1 hypothetical protein [Alphaproteobacteria bacterium]MBU2350766.1 hypothetical protein [Alphaproteobacteria bacterium]MBU2381975.1 hypothetical protein [Alphaproteobacteria bacterium]
MGPLLVVLLTSAAIQDAAPCSMADVVGVWELAAVETDNASTRAVYDQAPHEWIRFGADGATVWLASSQPRTSLDVIEADLDAADRMDGGDWRTRFSAPGRLLLTRDGQVMEIFDCVIARGDEPQARAGDLILTSAPGRTQTRRVQRRVVR